MAAAMNGIKIFLLLISPAISQAIVASAYTEYDFIRNIPETPHFIMFHAPWCSHCQRLLPLWDKLAESYKNLNLDVKSAKVDCTKETPLCAKEDIKAYPTLRFFNKGDKATYRENRDVAEFIKFSQKQLGSKDQENVEELTVEVGGYLFEKEIQEGLKFVNFYAPWCKHCQKLTPVWQQLAEELRYNKDIKILKVNCDEEKTICKSYGIKAYPSLILFHQGMQVVHYQGDRSFEDLLKFTEVMIQKYVVSIWETMDTPPSNQKQQNTQQADPVPIQVIEAPDTTNDEVISLGRDTFNIAVESGKTFVYFFAPWCKYCKEFTPIWEQLARKVIEKGMMIKIAKIDCTKETSLCDELQISEFPSIILFNTRFKMQKYQGPRTLEELYNFLKRHERDEL